MEITTVADLHQLEADEVTESAEAMCTITCSITCWITSFAN